MASRADPSFGMRFGEFELNAVSGELRKGGTLLKIHPQPFRMLLLLAERSGQIVSREEIRQRLWGDNTFVDFAGGINFCIKQTALVSNGVTLYMRRLRPSPDGKYLAFEGESADSNVWLLKDF